jgi:hypothetical protein
MSWGTRIAPRITKPIGERLDMVARIGRAAISTDLDRSLFDGVHCFCLFIGYPRSGHSLVGSIIDAHPNAVIAHELDALRYVQTGIVGRDLLYRMILLRDREFTSAGRIWTGYEYTVPGQAQGRFDELRVIGDKRGGGSTRRLGAHPELLDQLERLVGVQVRMVHVFRHPLDTITSMHRRGGRSLPASIERFFDLCVTNEAVRARDRASVIDVGLESLVANPIDVVQRLMAFLGLDSPPGFLEACAAVVFDAPKQTRTSIEWPPDLAADVEARMRGYDFLREYSPEV